MSTTSGPQQTPAGRHQVVIFVCGPNFTTKAVEVVAASSSTSAPSISIGADSAQALADLLDQQFKVSSVVTGGNPPSTEFILIKQGA